MEVKSGCPKTLVAGLPLSAGALKLPLAVNAKYSTRFRDISETSSPFVPVIVTPYGETIVAWPACLTWAVKPCWPSTR